MRSLARAALAACLLATTALAVVPAAAAQQDGGEASFSSTCLQLRCHFEVTEAPETIEGNITEVEWTFGPDGENETGNPVEHVFPDAGTYEVTVAVSGEGGENATPARATQEVTVVRGEVPWSALGFGVAAFLASIVLARLT